MGELSAELMAREIEIEKEIDRRRARTSLLAFTMATKSDFEPNWHHVAICHLVDVLAEGGTCRQLLHRLGHTDAEISDGIKRPHEVTGLYMGMTQPAMLDEEIPNAQVWLSPRAGKSELISRRMPAWVFGRNPDAQIIATSFGADLAQQMNRDVQRVIDEQDNYGAIFPNTRLAGSNIRTVAFGSFLRNSDLFEIVGHKGFYKAAGIGGAIMGRGVSKKGFAIVDDPFKSRKQAESPVERHNALEWYNSTLYSRIEKGGKRLIINTRWHRSDISGASVSAASLDSTAEQYFCLIFPALLDCQPGPGDRRRQGEALWPERYNVKKLHQIRSTMGSYEFEALHQQRPVAKEGNIIKQAWLKFYDVLPAGLSGHTMSVDLSFEDKGDFSSFQIWASRGADRYWLAHLHARMTFTEQLQAFKSLQQRYPMVATKLVEAAANGSALIDTLRKHVQGIIPVKPTTSKEVRVLAVSPQFEAGNVYFPSPRLAPWVDRAIDEICAFPTAAHDDITDACSQYLLRAQQQQVNWNCMAISLKDQSRPTEW